MNETRVREAPHTGGAAVPANDANQLIDLPTDRPIWDRFFSVSPLVLVGSKEADGHFNLAPKHLAMPLGWGDHYCFVCTPSHTTYHNVRRHGQFTVSYPRLSEVLFASLAAAPRQEDQAKLSLPLLPTFPARQVDGVLVEECYLYLECTLHSVLDGFGPNSLIVGNVVAAAVREGALRDEQRDAGDQLFHFPLLAYLSPGRVAEVRHSTAFPFPKGFAR